MDNLIDKVLNSGKKVKETKIQNMITKALKGDKDAVEYLHLRTQYLSYHKATSLTWDLVQADYNLAASTYVAAENLQLETLKRTAKKLLQYVSFASKGFGKKLEKEAKRVSAEDQMRFMH